MQETILIIYLVVSIILIGVILLQQGKGAEMGASFGAGGANTVFGAAGSGNALTKATTILAILFFGIALTISYFNSEPKVATKDSVIDGATSIEQKVEPTSIEDELPTANDGIESEVAPSSLEEKSVEKKSIESETAPNLDLKTEAQSKVDKLEQKAESQLETAKQAVSTEKAELQGAIKEKADALEKEAEQKL